uniref:Uncharacterized protein n=1 Tax=Solanum lycopersicum TaxID=4081 RepID=A0A3Q7HF28_SOLLC
MNDLLCQIFSSMVEKMQDTWPTLTCIEMSRRKLNRDFLQMFSLHSTWCFLYYSPEGGVMQAFLEKAYYSSGWFIYCRIGWTTKMGTPFIIERFFIFDSLTRNSIKDKVISMH